MYTLSTNPELVTDLTYLNGHNKAKFTLSTEADLVAAATSVHDAMAD